MKSITIKLHNNGQSQVIHAPEEFEFPEGEFTIKKLGDTVFLLPVDKAWETFIEGVNGFTDCFFPNGREPQGDHDKEAGNLWDTC